MNKPKVSMLWINYNSLNILNYIIESIKSMINQDYNDYEIILLDNNSVDGSWEKILDYIYSSAYELLKRKIVKLIRTKKNLGYNDGVNIAYRLIDPRSKYIAIVNSDARLKNDFISYQVRFMERNPYVGAVQGIVLKWKSNYVDSTGFYIDRGINLYPVHKIQDISKYESLCISHVEATVPFYRVKALRESVSKNYIFLPGSFILWFDGVFVGRKLWAKGYKSILLTQVLAEHRRGSTTRVVKETSPIIDYFRIRNRIAFILLSDAPMKQTIIVKTMVREIIRNNVSYKIIFRALHNGFDYARLVRKKYNVKIEIFHGPIVIRRKRSKSIVYYK